MAPRGLSLTQRAQQALERLNERGGEELLPEIVVFVNGNGGHLIEQKGAIWA